MDVRQLTALVNVADNSSFSAAADALGTVQSNVSTHVARLEKELGAVLYDRLAGRLTAEGEVVVARARRVIAELQAISLDVAALTHEVSGSVRVGMIGTTARWLAPRIVALVPQRHPRVQLVVVEGTSTVLGPQLASGQLDLAVLNLPVPGHDVSAELLFEEELVLVVPADDVLARRSEISLAELTDLDLILPIPGTAFRDELDSACAPLGIRLRPRVEIDGTRLIASLTFEGYGPAVLPATAVPAFLRDEWRMVRVRDLPPRRVGVAQRTRGLLSAPARALHGILHELVREAQDMPDRLRPAPADADGNRRTSETGYA
ncbi:MAG: LysR family transcriptional regulator [Actinomycetota bacterium]|nr:LysR family transcriptional regulator [Actinomycetota bacterium]